MNQNKRYLHKKPQTGFTMVELMVTVAIVGILAAVAYPAYTNNLEKSRRSDAQGALMNFAQAAERQFTVDGTYAGLDGDKNNDITSRTSPTIFPSEAPLEGDTKYYDLVVMIADGSKYQLRAIPKGVQSSDGFLQITSSGSKGWDEEGTGALTNW